jgi:hypothetical protein
VGEDLLYFEKWLLSCDPEFLIAASSEDQTAIYLL